MPAAVPIIAAAAFSATSITAAGALAFSWSAFALSAVSSIALSAISRALAPKPKSASVSLDTGRASTTQNVRQAVTSHQIVYGVRRVSGPIVFISSSNSNSFIHLVVVLAAHEVESIDEVWLNDYCIPSDALDSDGNVTRDRYQGNVRIKKHFGSPTQGADLALVAECPEWTSDHRLQGRAYVYVRLQFNQDKFPSGIPNISAVVRGKKILDPRDSTLRFTTNNALFAYDFLSNSDYGLESNNFIDIDSINAAANLCDEFVSVTPIPLVAKSIDTTADAIIFDEERLRFQLGDRVQLSTTGTFPTGIATAGSPYYIDDAQTNPLYSDDALTDSYNDADSGGGSTSIDYYVVPIQYKDTPRIALATSFDNALAGIFINITSEGTGTLTVTKNAEPRYHGAGLLSTESNIGDNFLDILSGFGGRAFYAGGSWKLAAPSYITPTVTLDEDDFISPMEVTTALPRREMFNQIKGIFTSPLNDWQPTDYPVMTDDAAVIRHGETISRDYDVPFASREFATQRLAKIEVLKANQAITVRVSCNLRAMQLQAGDTVNINNARFGWSSKPFEVISFKFILGGNDETPSLGVELLLRETAAAIYDWSTSEESDIDIAPNSNLPDAFNVPAVTGVSFSSRPVDTALGDLVFALVLQWTPSPDLFVLAGGQYEIQFKLSADTEWRPSFFVSGEVSFADVQQASVNTSYDLRIRALNNLGVRSSWVTILGATVGTSGGVGTTQDWGLFTHTTAHFLDWGLFSDTVTATEDWEFYT